MDYMKNNRRRFIFDYIGAIKWILMQKFIKLHNTPLM